MTKVLPWQEDISTILADPPVGSGVWCQFQTHPFGRWGHYLSPIKANRLKKKKTTYAKPREGTDAFSLPENRKTVKKVNQRFFKDGVVRQKKKKKKRPEKTLSKKWLLGAFYWLWRRREKKRESDGKKPWRYVCVCRLILWEYEHSTVVSWPSGLFRLSE